MDFLVDFAVDVPPGTPETDVRERERAEVAAAAELVDQGHLLRVWKRPHSTGETTVLGLYRADSRSQLDGLLGALPLADWMRIAVTPLEPHPNDPVRHDRPGGFRQLPEPRLTPVFRLDAELGEALEVGDSAGGHRRIVPLTGGTFTGPEINGTLVAGVSADWQIVLPDGTALGDLRYTLRTDAGDLSTSDPAECATAGPRSSRASRAARTSTPAEYIFRTSTPDRDRRTRARLAQ